MRSYCYLFDHLEAEFGSADATVVILQFDPKLMLAGRDLGLQNIDAFRADKRHDPLSYVDGGSLRYVTTTELGSIAAPPNAWNCNFKSRGECSSAGCGSRPYDDDIRPPRWTAAKLKARNRTGR